MRRWAPPLIWAGIILLLTSIPGTYVPSTIDISDKLVHFGLYGVLGALTERSAGPRVRPWAALLLVVAAVAVFAAVDEWHQLFIAGRSTDIHDWLADVAGALLGAAAMAIFGSHRGANTAGAA